MSKKRIVGILWMIVGLFIALALLSFIVVAGMNVYLHVSMKHDMQRYSGDGTMHDISWYMHGIPVNGWRLAFDSFSLGRDFSKTYTLRGLPSGYSASIHIIPSADIPYDEMIRALEHSPAHVQIEVLGEEPGDSYFIEKKLNELTVASSGLAMYLYDGDRDPDNWNFNTTSKEYSLRVDYTGDPSLKNFDMYTAIEWGGHL